MIIKSITMRREKIIKKIVFLCLVVLVSTFPSIVYAYPSSVNVYFNQWDDGSIYTQSMAATDFGSAGSVIGGDRLRIYKYYRPTYIYHPIYGYRKYLIPYSHLRIEYPAGQIGSANSGGSFRVYLDGGTEYILEYKVKFDPNFEWVKGGKLPGLCGGACYTGGVKPTGDGFSARFMWRENGLLVAYLYHMDQPGNYGEDISTGFYLPKDEWVTIKLRIKLNTGNNNDGILQVWVNGQEKIYRNNIRYMNDPTKKIDKFYFSTFYGGNTSDWAPSITTYAMFDDFVIQKIN